MTKHLVWFAPQYGNPGCWRECTVDRFGVWRGPTGSYIPAPSPDRVKQAPMTPLQYQLARSWVGQEVIRAYDVIVYVSLGDRKALLAAKRQMTKRRALGLVNHDRVITDFPRGPIQ